MVVAAEKKDEKHTTGVCVRLVTGPCGLGIWARLCGNYDLGGL